MAAHKLILNLLYFQGLTMRQAANRYCGVKILPTMQPAGCCDGAGRYGMAVLESIRPYFIWYGRIDSCMSDDIPANVRYCSDAGFVVSSALAACAVRYAAFRVAFAAPFCGRRNCLRS